MIKASISGAERARFKAWTRTLTVENRAEVIYIVRKHTFDMQRLSKLKADKPLFKEVTGRLRSSIIYQFSPNGLGSTVRVEVDYAPHVEFGTRPHTILPKRGRFLAFKPSGSNKYVFARKVEHPGSPPKPFFYNTWEQVQKNFINDLRKLGFKEA